MLEELARALSHAHRNRKAFSYPCLSLGVFHDTRYPRELLVIEADTESEALFITSYGPDDPDLKPTSQRMAASHFFPSSLVRPAWADSLSSPWLAGYYVSNAHRAEEPPRDTPRLPRLLAQPRLCTSLPCKSLERASLWCHESERFAAPLPPVAYHKQAVELCEVVWGSGYEMPPATPRDTHTAQAG
jgi:hypothetical protein